MTDKIMKLKAQAYDKMIELQRAVADLPETLAVEKANWEIRSEIVKETAREKGEL